MRVEKIGDVEIEITMKEHNDFSWMSQKMIPNKSTTYLVKITNTTKNNSCQVRAQLAELEPFQQEAIDQIFSEIIMRYDKIGYFKDFDNSELLQVVDKDWVDSLKTFQKMTNTGYNFLRNVWLQNHLN